MKKLIPLIICLLGVGCSEPSPVKTEINAKPTFIEVKIKNSKELQQQLFTQVSKDYQFDKTLYVYTTWVGICGNDEQFNEDNIEQNDELYYNFLLENKSYSFGNKSIIVTSIELGDYEDFIKKNPTSLKIYYQFKNAKNVTFTLTDKKQISKDYKFRQLGDNWDWVLLNENTF